MNCEELRARLDPYARRILSPEQEAAFEAHLGECADCAAFLEAAEPFPVAAASLPRRIDPERDLWPRIRLRLPRRGEGGGRRVMIPAWALAAAAVLLVVLSSVTTALLLRRPAGITAGMTAAYSPLEAQYASATADLVAALDQARARLAPGTIATVERNLAVIDSALAESRRALAGDPGNTALEQLVVFAWRQKMEFLRRATALGPES